MDSALFAEQRAHFALQAMTLDEQLQLVHGTGWGVLRDGDPIAPGHNGGAGFVPGIPRLHVPDINLADSAVGIRFRRQPASGSHTRCQSGCRYRVRASMDD
jgi:beta-glucosidase